MAVIPIGIQNQTPSPPTGEFVKRSATRSETVPRPRQGSHPLAGCRAQRTPPESFAQPPANGRNPYRDTKPKFSIPNWTHRSIQTQRSPAQRVPHSPTPTGVAPISRRSSEANTSGNDPPRISDPERGRVHSQPQTHPTPTGHNANFTQISQNPTNQTPKSGNLVNFRKISRKKVNPILA